MRSILSHLVFNSQKTVYTTQAGIEITRSLSPLEVSTATDQILNRIDSYKGALFSSGYEYPGRYSRWDIGFICPCIQLRASGRSFSIEALNERGKVLLDPIFEHLLNHSKLTITRNTQSIQGEINPEQTVRKEEERTKQPSIFTVIRSIKDLFASPQDAFLGLHGAFGYDLVFQFEPMELNHARPQEKADLILYLPDEFVIVDHQLSCAYQLSYEFNIKGKTTAGYPRTGELTARTKRGSQPLPEYQRGKYSTEVEKAIEAFKRGDLFEVVLSHTLFEPCEDVPSEVFKRLQKINPSPYGFIINLGNEHLVGSSPEMYVRVEGSRVETCPISGTIKRGKNAIEDADQIRELLNSYKDEAELTMCTDVDRNDKSRICIPGSVEVIGRRQLEMYSHLIHTVDHVEGYLKPEYDALDAFMTHMWAVTITGAPKRAAIRWIENHEDTPREWYGGAVGYYSFNGSLNTGLTLRTIQIKNGIAAIRAGATLLYDSIPAAEEEETLTKAAALVKAIRSTEKTKKTEITDLHVGIGKRILFVDHEDSFVHTLANYFQQTGAEVLTLRAPFAREVLQSDEVFDLVVLSPGPGRPEEFKLSETIQICIQRGLPIFGVCLGLQGIVEYFGGSLGVLEYPQHGKSSLLKISKSSNLWRGLPESFRVSRYHSLYASMIPDGLQVIARSEDGVVMAVEHETLPITAVQFHPESILSLRENVGYRILENVIRSSF